MSRARRPVETTPRDAHLAGMHTTCFLAEKTSRLGGSKVGATSREAFPPREHGELQGDVYTTSEEVADVCYDDVLRQLRLSQTHNRRKKTSLKPESYM